MGNEEQFLTFKKPPVFQPQKNVWGKGKGRTYKRHSVDRDCKKFSGFKTMRKIVDAAPDDLVRAFIVFLWATGGRVTETLNLKKEMFTLNTNADPPILVVDNVPLEKCFKKKAEYFECKVCGGLGPKARECSHCGADLVANGRRRYVTEKVEKSRNEFFIGLDDPFADIMLKWLKHCDGYLFLNPMTQRPFSRKWAYVQVRDIGSKLKLEAEAKKRHGEMCDEPIELWPHRFRSERASYLGTLLSAHSLLEYFTWEHWATAKKYSKKGALGLAKEVGFKVQTE